MSTSLQELGRAVKRLQNRHHNALNVGLRTIGVSLVQWDALRHVDQSPEASLHDLAQLTFQTDQAFGTLAGRMVERGLIERLPGPGRAVRHRLTDHGRQVHREGAEIVDRVLTDSFAPLTPDQRELLGDLLERLLVGGAEYE
ncbi:MarR family transcriptional regulator [Streptomyces sp. ISL-1]|uniref:MarR family winged helix-turn-helix transcriptional regulator n=1 Tax=Streptomyces sp. ISL-1 TaxID=2817657 RepID=UPI001BE9A07B|nr:MarR family transcriptional regulator [Streptomyces sp. ISL-1]MBT2388632.1 MarR family transcriptional regulator [Streptomyces sp. ISL-1]